MSPNRKRGVELLVELSITDALKLKNLNKITLCDDLIGIWAQLDVDDIYPFTKVEKEQMKEIRALLKKDINDKYIELLSEELDKKITFIANIIAIICIIIGSIFIGESILSVILHFI